MTSLVAGAAAWLGWEAAKTAVDYTSEVIGSTVALKTVINVKEGIENYGTQIAGPIGRKVFNLFGRAAAGHTIEAARAEGVRVAEAVRTVCEPALDALAAQTTKTAPIQAAKVVTEQTKATEEKSGVSLGYKVYKVTKALGVFGLGVAGATGIAPVVPVGLAIAACNAFPKIVDATLTKVDPNKETVNFVDDVVVPVMKQAAIQSTGVMVEGIVRYDVVKGTHDVVVLAGENIGRGLTAFLPQCIQNAAGKVGGWMGGLEGARVAMSPETIRQATEKGELARDVTTLGLETIDTTVKLAVAKDQGNGGVWKIAKNTAIIAAGVLGGAALVYATPAAATVLGVTASLGVADRAIVWVKLKAAPKEAGTPEDIEAGWVEINPENLDEVEGEWVIIDPKTLDKGQDKDAIAKQLAIATLATTNDTKVPGIGVAAAA